MPIEDEVQRLREEEEYKRFLYDKTIGGSNVPRPTDEYIEKCVGPLKSEQDIMREAEEIVRKQDEAEQLALKRQDVYQRSLEQHNNSIKAKQGEDLDRDKAEARSLLQQQDQSLSPDHDIDM